jgi:hypothetical protein
LTWTENLSVSYSPEVLTSYVGGQNLDTEIKSTENAGQTFNYSGNGTYNITSFEVYLKKNVIPSEQLITVFLRSSWDGTNICSDSISSDDLEYIYVFESFTCESNLTKGDIYYIRITTNSTEGDIELGYHNSGTYTEGDLINNSGDALSGEDALFKIKGFSIVTLDLNLSARSCNDTICSGENWTEIIGTPPIEISEIDNQYFQYKFDFETDNQSYSPELYDVTVSYATPEEDSPGRSGGGGCHYKWNCTEWDECLSSGIETRSCENMGSCSDSRNPPELEQNCTYVKSIEDNGDKVLFDVIASTLKESRTISFPYRNLSFIVELIKFGDITKPTSTNINYLITNDYNNTIFEENETVEVYQDMSFMKSISLSQNLEQGTYWILVKIYYGNNQTAESFDSFRLAERGLQFSLDRNLYVGIISIFILTGIISSKKWWMRLTRKEDINHQN